ncbi:MAG TPA: sigma-70 family RNA polymerase sigma factor [Thermoanaerobaculia bacterium]
MPTSLTFSESDESALVARLRAGDESAYETLVRTSTAPLLRTARRILRSEEDAREALQETFLAVWKSIGKFQSQSRLTTWLHRIAINACLMRLRSRNRVPEVDDIEKYLPRFLEDGHQIESSVAWESPESMLQESELRAFVRRSIDQLPDSYRIVLLLRDIEELSTEETAEVLGITRVAVKVRLHRARQALRTLLDPHMKRRRP